MAKSKSTKPLSASLEDYLEAILQIDEAHQTVRTSEVAAHLKVEPPSVTHALHQLSRRKLIDHKPYRGIRLTAKGRRVAEEVARKHWVLKTFFMDVLAVKETIADDCACHLEHSIPDDVLERFIAYIQFEERCHRGGTEWVDGTGFVCHARMDKDGARDSCAQADPSAGDSRRRRSPS